MCSSDLILAVAGLVAGRGLLKRREWARKLTIGLVVLLTIGIAPVWGSEALGGVSPGLSVVAFGAACVFHLAIIRRLQQPAVRAEFAARVQS